MERQAEVVMQAARIGQGVAFQVLVPDHPVAAAGGIEDANVIAQAIASVLFVPDFWPGSFQFQFRQDLFRRHHHEVRGGEVGLIGLGRIAQRRKFRDLGLFLDGES